MRRQSRQKPESLCAYRQNNAGHPRRAKREKGIQETGCHIWQWVVQALDGNARPVSSVSFPSAAAPLRPGMTGVAFHLFGLHGLARHAVLQPEPHNAQDLRKGGEAFFQHSPADAVLEGRKDGVLGGPANRDDEGDAEAGTVGLVECREAGEFCRREGVQPSSRLFARAVVSEFARYRGAASEVGVAAQELRLAIRRRIQNGVLKRPTIASREVNGRFAPATSATQGPCSAMPPNNPTKASCSSASTSSSDRGTVDRPEHHDFPACAR